MIVAIIVVVVFGGSWLPKAARNLGRAKVEVDKAQQQFNEAKAQVVEATGIEKADAALKKANRALNSSPQSLMKNAAKSAITPTAAAAAGDAAEDGEAVTGAVEDAEIVDRRPATDAVDAIDEATVNVDFNDD